MPTMKEDAKLQVCFNPLWDIRSFYSQLQKLLIVRRPVDCSIFIKIKSVCKKHYVAQNLAPFVQIISCLFAFLLIFVLLKKLLFLDLSFILIGPEWPNLTNRVGKISLGQMLQKLTRGFPLVEKDQNHVYKS